MASEGDLMPVLERHWSMEKALTIPAGGAESLAGFRAWYASEDFPEEGFICYLGGELFIDFGPERISSHVAVKGEMANTLDALSEELNLGQYFASGCRVVSEEADFSCEPDGCYLTWAAFQEGRVGLTETADGTDFTEVVGAPEIMLEIVGPSSF